MDHATHAHSTLAGVAALYVRISHDRHLSGLANDRQDDKARQVASQRGLSVPSQFVIDERERSAKKGRMRPEFARLLSLIESDRITHVVCYKIDRLTRNYADTGDFVTLCQDHGITVVEASGNYDYDMTTARGRSMFSGAATQAETENGIKSERMIDRNIQARAAGMMPGGRRAFGYKANWKVKRDEAEAVRLGYQWVIAGESMLTIAKRWNAMGLRTPQGRRERGAQVKGAGSLWTGPVVSRCLRKPLYAGIQTYKGEEIGVGAWDAIVDRVTWERAMVIMTNPGRRARTGNKRLLTGVAVCGICGGGVNGSGAPRPTDQGTYSCKTRKHFSRMASPIDTFVEQAAIERLSKMDAADLVASPEDQDRFRELHERKAELRKDKDDLAVLFTRKVLTFAGIEQASAEIDRSLEMIDRELDAFVVDGTTEQIHSLVGAQDVEAAWDALTIDVRRRVIGALFTVVIHPAGRGRRPAPGTINPETVEVIPR